MGPWAISGCAPARRAARAVRGRARLSRPRPAVVDRRAAPGDPSRACRPTVIRALMAHGEEPVRGHDRSSLRVLGLDRRAVEPGSLVVVLPRRRRGSLPDRQLLGWDGGVGRDRQRQRHGSDQAGVVLGSVHRDGGGRRRRRWAIRPRRGRRAGHPGADARHDPRVLARRGAVATRRPTGRGSRAPGSMAIGRAIDRDGFWYIQGRSDDTLKVAGKRVGPAEVESAAVSHRPCWRRRRSASRTRSRARSSWCSWSFDRGEPATRTLLAAIARTVTGRARQAPQARARGGRRRPSQDALGQGHAPGDPGGLAGPRPGRPVRARRPGVLDADPRRRDRRRSRPMTETDDTGARRRELGRPRRAGRGARRAARAAARST